MVRFLIVLMVIELQCLLSTVNLVMQMILLFDEVVSFLGQYSALWAVFRL